MSDELENLVLRRLDAMHRQNDTLLEERLERIERRLGLVEAP